MAPVKPVLVFSRELRCGEKSCNTPLPVIVVRNPETNREELEEDAATWERDELRCPSNHLIPKW
jgi:hypothetical protein